MYEFILQIVIFSSLGVMIYFLAQGLARAGETISAVGTPRRANFFDRLLRRLPLEKMDASLGAFFEKTLRRLRVFLLKVDNRIHSSLERIRRHGNANSNGEKRGGLFAGSENGNTLDDAPKVGKE